MAVAEGCEAADLQNIVCAVREMLQKVRAMPQKLRRMLLAPIAKLWYSMGDSAVFVIVQYAGRANTLHMGA